MSILVKRIFYLLVIFSGMINSLYAQKNIFPADSSVLTSVRFGKDVYLDKRGFFTAVAIKTSLN